MKKGRVLNQKYFFTVMIFNFKKRKENNDLTELAESNNPFTETEKENFIIPVEPIPFCELSDPNRLTEIKDINILARVDALIPGFPQAGMATANAAGAANINGVVYKVVIPENAKLVNSKSLPGAKRGLYMGADGIQGHANLVEQDSHARGAVVGNTGAAVMAVAALVVGQYYMTQINKELNKINDEISKIADFRDNEYRSRVFGLASQVRSISAFQSEILENDELRISKISQLNNLEQDCIELLGQANLTLAGFTKETDLNYNEYEELLAEIQNWHMYQKTLLAILYRISDLKYALHFGKVSREQCSTSFSEYEKQVDEAQEMLTRWHKYMTQKLEIDVWHQRRKRVGIDGAMHMIPGKVINEKYSFREIPEETVKMIRSQSSGSSNLFIHDTSNLYTKEVTLYAKDGRVYYMPEGE